MGKMKVLFLCTHNSARLPMAEGLLRHFYGDKYEVFSARATPTRANFLAVKVMAEAGIDISKHRSKSIEEFRGKAIDLVGSVCESREKVICPICSSPIIGDRPSIVGETLPKAKHYLHRPFSDPSVVEGGDERKITVFRRTRDDVKKWVLDDFASLNFEGS